MRRFHLGLIAVFVCIVAANVRAVADEKPKLLVLIVFDQMRGDYTDRWRKLFVEGGFERLRKNGAWFTNCHYPYAATLTGPGHASMLTGCSPDQHGIITNEWYDRKLAAIVNCAESDRYQRVPALPKAVEPSRINDPVKSENMAAPKAKVKLAGSPEYLLAPTVGDVLKDATGGKSKVVGLSFKDRSALLPVGRAADAVYWLDSADGMFVTSSFYRDSIHSWVAEFNASRVADRWFAKEWDRILPNIVYQFASGPDAGDGEGTGIKQGVVFPHPIDGGLSKPETNYYNALFNSPFGNDLLFELAKRAIVAEKLGRNDVPDLLVISFSSNDAIGHCWGPDSQEVLDVTLRSDRILVELLAFLDKQVGAGQYTLALTADHGVCPLPEVTAATGKFAKRLPFNKYLAAAEVHLREKFMDPPDAESRWIESVQPPWIYLNANLAEARNVKVADVARELGKFLAEQEGVERTFTRGALAGDFPPDDAIGMQMKRSYHPDRSGDVAFVTAPYCLSDGTRTGTTHGSPHPYDTHVPLIFFGKGITPGMHNQRVAPQAIASVLSEVAGLKPPRLAAYPVPVGVVHAK